MSRKKLIITLASALFIVCTIATSFTLVNHNAHAQCITSNGIACPTRPAPTPTSTPTPLCAPTVAYGSTGTWVKQLQTSLNSAENAGLAVDGRFGRFTKAAVLKWQHHVFPHTPREWDGIVGPHTWKTLGWCY